MKSLRLLEPLPYLDFVRLMERAAVVLTDSGGIQEETTALGVPCLTLRPSTERPITTTRGTNTAVGVDPCRIAAAWKRTLAEVKRVLRRRGTVGMTTWAEDPATPAGQIWDEELLAAQHRDIFGYLESLGEADLGRKARIPSSSSSWVPTKSPCRCTWVRCSTTTGTDHAGQIAEIRKANGMPDA